MTNAVAAAIHAANTAKRIASAPPASHLSRPDTPGRAGRRKGVHEVTESLTIAAVPASDEGLVAAGAPGVVLGPGTEASDSEKSLSVSLSACGAGDPTPGAGDPTPGACMV
jgi:hypothetical protein